MSEMTMGEAEAYRAGLAEMRERAARVCDALRVAEPSPATEFQQGMAEMAHYCAFAIRAMEPSE